MRITQIIKDLGPLTVMEIILKSGIDTHSSPDIGDYLPISIMNNVFKQNLMNNLSIILRRLQTKLEASREILIVGPELILLETLCALYLTSIITIILKDDLNAEMVERISLNIPIGMTSRVLQIPALPKPQGPADVTMIAIGLDAGGGYLLIPEFTKRIFDFFLPNYYYGDVFLIDPTKTCCMERPLGWFTIKKSSNIQLLKPEFY